MTESSPNKVAHISDKDLISDLPTNIIGIILLLLPIRDAVRTSIVSKKWRHEWTTLPHLVFDDQFVNHMKKFITKLNHVDPKLKAYEFVSVINKVLLFQKANIHKFSLCIPTDYHSQTISDYIDQWTLLLARYSVKELTIDISEPEPYKLPFHIFYKYKLHFHIFSCLELTHLKLRQVQFGDVPNSFGGFPNLTNLELTSVSCPKGFIIKCPVLESLTLMDCTGLISHLNFNAPNLKILYVKGWLIPFRCTESIQVFSMTMTYREPDLYHTKTSNLVKVLACLPKIQTFSVGRNFLQYLAAGGVPNRISTPIHLKNLIFSDVNFAHPHDVSCLVCLLQNCPSLCKIQISALGNNYASKAASEDFRIQDNVDCTLSHLQTVIMCHISGFRAEMELIKYLLAKSPVLETIFIHRNTAVKPETALTMAEEIMQSPRASLKALIRHLKHPVGLV